MLDLVNFSYIGPNGPQKWGTLSPSFAACSNGKAQSPVDLVMTDIVMNQELKSLDRNYLPTNATLVNNQFNIGVCMFINYTNHFKLNVCLMSDTSWCQSFILFKLLLLVCVSMYQCWVQYMLQKLHNYKVRLLRKIVISIDMVEFVKNIGTFWRKSGRY